MARCKSCGDVVRHPNRPEGFEKLTVEQLEIFWAHCDECAAEKLFNHLPPIGTTMHDAGGGRRVIRDGKTLA